MDNKYLLPDGWILSSIGDTCTIHAGYAFPNYLQGKSRGQYPFYKVGDISKNVQAGRIYLSSCENYVDDIELKILKAKLIPENTIVFAKVGAALKLNRRAVTKKLSLVDNNAVGVKANNKLLNDLYLYFFLRTVDMGDYSRETTIPSIRTTDIKGIPIPLPTLPEQKEIVSRIEELFSSLEQGIKYLTDAKEKIKTYRQAVLRDAFDGKLSGDINFNCENLGKHLISIQAGKSYNCIEKTPQENEIGLLKISAVTWGVFDENESKTCPSLDNLNEEYVIHKDDFLFSRANTLELVGNCVIVDKITKTLMLSDKILRFKFDENTNKKYILYYLRSPYGREEIQKYASGNQLSMRNISQKNILKIRLSYCSVDEQNRIVSEIEKRFTICDSVDKIIDANLQKAELLRQSILKQAFEGKLTGAKT